VPESIRYLPFPPYRQSWPGPPINTIVAGIAEDRIITAGTDEDVCAAPAQDQSVERGGGDGAQINEVVAGAAENDQASEAGKYVKDLRLARTARRHDVERHTGNQQVLT
jgi:hypothetical protein